MLNCQKEKCYWVFKSGFLQLGIMFWMILYPRKANKNLELINYVSSSINFIMCFCYV